MSGSDIVPLDSAVLPAGVRSRFVPDINGLRMHLLEAGFEAAGRPCVLLLHGFPELAYSWRKVMPLLAAAGFHVVAPDLRGYGRTTGWHADYDVDGDLQPFRMLNAVRDALGLVSALGYRSVAAVVGHDFGSPVAAWCALVRPDVFRSVALMSAPFAGPPALPFNTANSPRQTAASAANIHEALATLDRPRKHYQWYYSTRPANADMWHCSRACTRSCAPITTTRAPTGRATSRSSLQGWTADELAKMPTYYIMDLARDDGGDGGARNAVRRRDRRVPLAAGQRTCRLCRRISAHRLPGRPAMVSLRHRAGCDTAELQLFSGQNDRRAVDLHRRQQRLGHLSASRRDRAHAGKRLHEHAGLSSDRRRRPLGAAGAAGKQVSELLVRFLRP